MPNKETTVIESGDINNSFIDALRQFRHGASIHELSEAMQKLVLAVMDREKKGSVTYTLTVHPRGGYAVTLVDKIELKMPEEKREEKVLFANDDGTLGAQNPEQRNLNLTEVQRPKPPDVVDITAPGPGGIRSQLNIKPNQPNSEHTKSMSEDQFQTILDAGRALGAPVTSDSPQAVLVVPENYEAMAFEKLIEPYLAAPRRVKQNVILADADSFIAYVKDFKQSTTRIFASVPPNNGVPSFTAIMDYHNHATTEGDKTGARWCEHRATLACSFTEEWKRWTAANRQKMKQEDFAIFLEENQSIVVEPAGADLLELITTLEGHCNVNISQAIKLNNGKCRLNYEEDVLLKGVSSVNTGAIEMPLVIKAGIQLFEGGTEYQFNNRLKYKIESRKITFWFEAVDVHLIIKKAVEGVVAKISTELQIEPLFGQP